MRALVASLREVNGDAEHGEHSARVKGVQYFSLESLNPGAVCATSCTDTVRRTSRRARTRSLRSISCFVGDLLCISYTPTVSIFYPYLRDFNFSRYFCRHMYASIDSMHECADSRLLATSS